MSTHTVDDLFTLLAERGSGRYGLSDVSQLEHALQSAALARADGLADAFVIAALFHDIGHLISAQDVEPAAAGIDDQHETVGAQLLAGVFGPAVAGPVRLHVPAKRYLCAREDDYFGKLSSDSVRSLALQGGPMSDDEADRFEALAGASAALALRRIDERAKVRGLAVPPLGDYRDTALALAQRSQPT